MNIVILDGETTNPGDLTWEPISRLGKLTVYPHTSTKDVIERALEADVIVANKTIISGQVMEQLPNLKCICLLATGYNNIDIATARTKNITVCNAVGYSTPSVAQHVFAHILHWTNAIAKHNASIQQGDWSTRHWSYTLDSMTELKDKVLGIYGFGRIGQKVAELGMGFDMKVIAHHKHPKKDKKQGVAFVSLEKLFVESDFLTLHAPLTEDNAGVVNRTMIQLMKESAILINTGRGGLINENDLGEALESGKLRGASLDVLGEEPPPREHPLIGLKQCVLTPHNAWATKESRSRLIEIVAENIKTWQKGKPQNQVA